MAYKVIIVPAAMKEIAQAAAWYANESLTIAAKWRDALLEHIATLEHFPERASAMVHESRFTNRNIRCLTYGTGRGQYRILFEIKNDTILILSVRHASRQWN